MGYLRFFFLFLTWSFVAHAHDNRVCNDVIANVISRPQTQSFYGVPLSVAPHVWKTLAEKGINERNFRRALNRKTGLPVPSTGPLGRYDLLVSADEILVYKLSVEVAENPRRMWVMDVKSNPSPREEADYYGLLAKLTNTEAEVLSFKGTINGFNKLYIPGRVVAKIKFKHGISVQEVLNAINNRNNEDIHKDGPEKFKFVADGYPGKPLKIVFVTNKKDIGLVTAHNFDHPENF